jgi:phage shock protein E
MAVKVPKNKTMNWVPLLIIAAVLAIVFVMKRTGQISAGDARAHLKNGALVIDVRSPGEFNSGHLPNVINIPLDEIETALPRRVKDKNQVLLLHCASGMRSSVAKKKLNDMGYANVFNLGSYGRVESILKQQP